MDELIVVPGDAEEISSEKKDDLYEKMVPNLKMIHNTSEEQGVPIDFEKYCEKFKGEIALLLSFINKRCIAK